MGVQFWLSMLALWILIHLYRDYRVDKFRHQLFCLRAELFRMGMNGDISFNDQAYRMVRELMNGDIRFAHRMNLLGILLLNRSTAEAVRRRAELDAIWKDAEVRLSETVFGQLRQLRGRLYMNRMKQLLLTSIVLQASFVAIFSCAVLWAVGRSIRCKIWATVTGSTWYTWLCEMIDCSQLLGRPSFARP